MASPSLSLYRSQSLCSEEMTALTLQTWEACGCKRDLASVLAAIADVLQPRLQFDCLNVVCFREGRAQFRATCSAGRVREPLAEDGPLRCAEPRDSSLAPRQKLPYDLSELERRLSSGKPFACADLMARSAWYEHEFQLAAAGVRAYVSMPLLFRGKPGAAVFARSKPQVYTAGQLAIVRAVSPAVMGAITSALEYEEIVERCKGLESENLELRSQLAQGSNDRSTNNSLRPVTHMMDDFFFMRNRMEDMGQDVAPTMAPSISIPDRLNQEERRLIEATLRATGGRISGAKGAAVRLGLPASTLEFRIRRLAIDKFRYRIKP